MSDIKVKFGGMDSTYHEEDPNESILGYPELMIRHSSLKSARETISRHLVSTYASVAKVKALHMVIGSGLSLYYEYTERPAVESRARRYEETRRRFSGAQEEFRQIVASFEPGSTYISLVDKEDVELVCSIKTERPQLDIFVAAAAPGLGIVQDVFKHHFGTYLEYNRLYALIPRKSTHPRRSSTARLASPEELLRYHFQIAEGEEGPELQHEDPNEAISWYAELKQKNSTVETKFEVVTAYKARTILSESTTTGSFPEQITSVDSTLIFDTPAQRRRRFYKQLICEFRAAKKEIWAKVRDIDTSEEYCISISDKDDVLLLACLKALRPELELFAAAARDIGSYRLTIVHNAFQRYFHHPLEHNQLYALVAPDILLQQRLSVRLATPDEALRCGFHSLDD